MKTGSSSVYDAVVIGAGFFGLSLALMLQERGLSVLVVEREQHAMQRASYHNQARVHAGYHYPRSLITALRSSVNFPRFATEFASCVVDDFAKYYAIAKIGSKVSAAQFKNFMERVGAPLSKPPAHIHALFNSSLIEAVFTVREFAFDSEKLAELMIARLREARVPVRYTAEAETVRQLPSGSLDLIVRNLSDGERENIQATWVFNCTYSQINKLNRSSGLQIIPLRHELTELALVKPPSELEQVGVTIMCGPFFSFMPFPARGLHSLSHVRYTPHLSWKDEPGSTDPLIQKPNEFGQASSFRYMQKDAERFLPCLADCEHVDSLWEIKTVLPLSDVDDSRPILFKVTPEARGLVHVMGGKIDNIFDIPQEIDTLMQCR